MRRFRTRLETELTLTCTAFAMLASCKVQLPAYEDVPDAGKSPAGSSASAKQDPALPVSSTGGNTGGTTGSSATAPSGQKPVGSASMVPTTPSETDGGVTNTDVDSGTPPSMATETPVATTVPSAPMMSSTAAAASTTVPVSKDVHGRIVDLNRRALPNIVVKVGEITTVTNQSGEFTITNAPDTYDVQFQINNDGASYAPRGWRYVGLTRRDPTLQSLNTDLPARSVNIKMSSPLDANSDDKVAVAFGSEQESFNLTLSNRTDTSKNWRGPAALNVKGHALQIHRNKDDFPTSYAAYEEAALSFTDAGTMTWDLKLPGMNPTPVTGKNITGSVSVTQEWTRTQYAYLLFNSNAVLPLIKEYPTTSGFTYLVPEISGSSVLLLARNKVTNSGGADAYAYRTGLAAGQTAVTIAIPDPMVLTAPQPGAVVTSETAFAWSGTDAVALFSIRDTTLDRRNFIVTSQKSLQAVKLAALELSKATEYSWEVQVHGHCSSVDECAGADGAFDPMYFFDESRVPTSAVKRDGSFSKSTERYVTISN